MSSMAVPNDHELLLQNRWRIEFEVDATNLLKSFPCERFSLIIFNFPHVGGKSNIKKNRLLLQKFFQSALQILIPSPVLHESNENSVGVQTTSGDCFTSAASEHGASLVSSEIWLTLCRGQGGTPAEAERKAPGDTWQVTEMAARANFILDRINKFQAADFPGYCPTGFRSQEKAFDPVGALTHVFTPAPSVQLESSILSTMKLEGESYYVMKHIKQYLRKLHSDHAIQKTSSLFHQDCFNKLKNKRPEDSFLVERVDFRFLFPVESRRYAKLVPFTYKVLPLLSDSQASGQSDIETDIHISCARKVSDMALCASVYQQLPDLVNLYQQFKEQSALNSQSTMSRQQRDHLIWCEGPVARFSTSEPSSINSGGPLKIICPVNRWLLMLTTSRVGQCLTNMVFDMLPARTDLVTSSSGLDSVDLESDPCLQTVVIDQCGLHVRNKTDHCWSLHDSDRHVLWHELCCEFSLPNQHGRQEQLYIAAFNLDFLAIAIFNELTPAINLFDNTVSYCPAMLHYFQPCRPIIYPPCFEYHLSFWLPPSLITKYLKTDIDNSDQVTVEYAELTALVTHVLTDILLSLSCGCALGLDLLEHYTCPVDDGSTSRISLCYRFVLIGWSIPLSSLTANKIQSNVRLALQCILGVQLR